MSIDAAGDVDNAVDRAVDNAGDSAVDSVVDSGLSDVLNSSVLLVNTKLREVKAVSQLILAETRVAVSRLRTLFVCAVLLLFSVLMTWLVAIALIYQCLLALDIGPVSALLILFATQTAACVILAIIVFKLGNKLSLPLSREALASSAR